LAPVVVIVSAKKKPIALTIRLINVNPEACAYLGGFSRSQGNAPKGKEK
jgi:hypothetical protein